MINKFCTRKQTTRSQKTCTHWQLKQLFILQRQILPHSEPTKNKETNILISAFTRTIQPVPHLNYPSVLIFTKESRLLHIYYQLWSGQAPQTNVGCAAGCGFLHNQSSQQNTAPTNIFVA